MPRICLLSAMKNEGPDVLEWALYHRLVGFDHILVYTNGCTDGSDGLLDALAGLGWLTHRRHTPPPGLSPQDAVAARAMADPALAGADWLMWLDADEFLVVHAGAGRVADLIAAARGAEALALNWRNFGDGGRKVTGSGLVVESFSHGMALDNPQSRSVKTLFRLTPRIAGFAIHRPIFTDGPEISFRDGAGKPLGHAFQFGRNKDDRPRHRVPEGRQSWRLGQINHYPIKALDRYLLKRLRGNGLDPNCAPERFDPEYLDIFNFNEMEDTALQRDVPALKAAMAEALANPAVAAAHAACTALDAARRAEVAPMIAALLPLRYRRGGPPSPSGANGA
ncbi:glycosyltransferase family 2 protein [Tabrizicola oligotrophica]|uniref:Glycosyltransferase family 2 protein n=1 Tax=Tabrizicola oligotrophica TaxID=2710650 RepID=A0A6M0QRI0_9RHOB|nr:glycosyltransferase family 2 protein [Tabrizicola oligotrophica]NEY89263.1 glycosyltransferase family 2 protein [Tabrizicola oligotrophica]